MYCIYNIDNELAWQSAHKRTDISHAHTSRIFVRTPTDTSHSPALSELRVGPRSNTLAK